MAGTQTQVSGPPDPPLERLVRHGSTESWGQPWSKKHTKVIITVSHPRMCHGVLVMPLPDPIFIMGSVASGSATQAQHEQGAGYSICPFPQASSPHHSLRVTFLS